MKRLYINPVTRTIAPKYRTQKAVYIAKKDHNSVLLLFEIPKIVDGYDITKDGNIIHIHYANISYEKIINPEDVLGANISYDELKVSRGMSEAEDITVDDEEGTVTFGWRVPNTATRYAGVVSIGITIERYEDVDGIPQEVYSWSTAPYGGTIVQDSMDNSDEVCEGDFDYLVKTCNAIVDLALKDKMSQVEQYKADVEAMRNETKGYRDNADYYSESAWSAADEAYAYLHGANDVVPGSEETNVVRLHGLTEEAKREAQIYADNANSFSQDAYIYTYGDESRPGSSTDNAKYFYEQTKSYAQNCCNAIIGTATGNNAVRINDVSPIPHNISISLKASNLINQEEFFKTNEYEIKGEIGKTYIFTCTYKDGVNLNEINLNGGVSGIFDYYTDENGELTVINGDFVTSPEPWKVTITEGHEYFWKTHVANASDIFESVSMVLADTSDVQIKSFGKNIFNYNYEDWQKEGNNNYIIYLTNLPLTTITISGKFKEGATKVSGFASVFKSKDNWENRENCVDNKQGIWVGGRIYDLTFEVESGYEYQLRTNKSSYDNYLEQYLEGIQIELGSTKTEYEPFKESVDGVVAVYPTTTLVANTNGVEITAEYNKDINKVIAKLEQAIANS